MAVRRTTHTSSSTQLLCCALCAPSTLWQQCCGFRCRQGARRPPFATLATRDFVTLGAQLTGALHSAADVAYPDFKPWDTLLKANGVINATGVLAGIQLHLVDYALLANMTELNTTLVELAKEW